MQPDNQNEFEDENPELPPMVISADEPEDDQAEKNPKSGMGFWQALLWSLSFLLVTVVGLLLGVAGRLLVNALLDHSYLDRLLAEIKQNEATQKTGVLLGELVNMGMLVSEVLSVLYILFVVRVKFGKSWYQQIALRLPSVTHLLIALIGLPALMLLHSLAHIAGHSLLGSISLPMEESQAALADMIKQMPLWMGIFVVGICPGIGEELLCRGFLGQGLVKRYGWLWGISLASLFFGLLHCDPSYAFGTMIMGVCLHLIYLTTRALTLTMLLHAINNSLSVLQIRNPAMFNHIDIDPNQFNVPLAIASVVMVAIMGITLWKTRTQWRDATGKLSQIDKRLVGITSLDRTVTAQILPISFTMIFIFLSGTALFYGIALSRIFQ